ncbi:hypothetical protein FRX31_016200 [Thalictrum thalictroides]|uniref:Uncharacterized protein n=1 Tax=Thalictrum thalictroides TaxID=46969 RepID=A0A7J6W9V4_THATH|nr:hypothetical protein FRX31_016200 [Thalictrum thalictroides]
MNNKRRYGVIMSTTELMNHEEVLATLSEDDRKDVAFEKAMEEDEELKKELQEVLLVIMVGNMVLVAIFRLRVDLRMTLKAMRRLTHLNFLLIDDDYLELSEIGILHDGSTIKGPHLGL